MGNSLLLLVLLQQLLGLLQQAVVLQQQSVPVVKTLSVPPIIATVTPSSGPAGTRAVIHGSGFDTVNNEVYTGYGKLVLPSADGTNLEFNVNPPFIPANLKNVKTSQFPELRFRFYVRTGRGLTASPGEFVFEP